MAQADYGGAIYSKKLERLEVQGSTFKYNKARVQGGAIYLGQLGSQYEIIINGTTFFDNLAGLNGDVIYTSQEVS